MINYKNILYCTDFSKDADIAFTHALDLAHKHRAKLYLLHVIHSPYHIRRDNIDEYVSSAWTDGHGNDRSSGQSQRRSNDLFDHTRQTGG